MARKLPLVVITLIAMIGTLLSHAPPVVASAGGEVVQYCQSEADDFTGSMHTFNDFALIPSVQLESAFVSPTEPGDNEGATKVAYNHNGPEVVTARTAPIETAQFIIWNRLPDAGDETQMDCSYQIDVQEEVSLRHDDVRGPVALQIDVKTLHGSSTLG